MRRPPVTIRGARLALGVAAASAAVLAVSSAVTAQQPSRGEAAKQLEQRKGQLTETEQRARQIQTDVESMREEQGRINAQLIDTGKLIQQTETRMSQIESRLGSLQVEERQLRGALAQRHGRIITLLSALQRMGRNPPPVIITRREDALEMVRSAMLLSRAFPELKSQADELVARLDQLVAVMTDIRTEADRLKGESQRLSDARTRLASLQDSKRQSLAERQRELEDVRKAAAEISRSVTDLSELISRLDRTVSERTGLGAYNREIEAAEAAARQQAQQSAPAQPPTAQAQAELRPTAPPETSSGGDAKLALAGPRPQLPLVALEPRGPMTANPGRMKPAVQFASAKRQLPLPAQGRRLVSFGDKTQYGRTSSGIVIETRQGAQITSPCDGWIVYAGEFRSYGQVLIINAGGGYHVLLAGLSHIDAQVGQFVLAQEPVGTMSTNSKVKGQDSAPVLYVEFRNKEGHPIDPDPWWAEGSQKVQG